LEDSAIAAAILKGRRVASGRALSSSRPHSRRTLLDAIEAGYIQNARRGGRALVTAGAGRCVGHATTAVPSDGENVISTANRNFQGPHGQQ